MTDDGAETTDARDSRRGAADEDPTAQDPRDAGTVETLHEMFPEAGGIGERYEPHFGLRETDSQGGWEASHPGHGDGPEPDSARVGAGVGGRGDDTPDAAGGTPGRTPDRLNVTGIGDRGHDGDHAPDRDGDVRDSRDAILRERTPDVANRVDNDAPPQGDSPDDTHVDNTDGGHLIGYAEFLGIGERLNQVPMRFDVNQNRTDTALPDIPEEARGGIDGGYRNVERSWRGVMRDEGEWHGFENSRFNDGAWEDALARDPENPRIDVRITRSYDPGLKPVEAPDDDDPKAPRVVDWAWLRCNGVSMGCV